MQYLRTAPKANCNLRFIYSSASPPVVEPLRGVLCLIGDENILREARDRVQK